MNTKIRKSVLSRRQPPKSQRREDPAPKWAYDIEAALEEALEGTFPASDPISSLQLA